MGWGVWDTTKELSWINGDLVCLSWSQWSNCERDAFICVYVYNHRHTQTQTRLYNCLGKGGGIWISMVEMFVIMTVHGLRHRVFFSSLENDCKLLKHNCNLYGHASVLTATHIFWHDMKRAEQNGKREVRLKGGADVLKMKDCSF